MSSREKTKKTLSLKKSNKPKLFGHELQLNLLKESGDYVRVVLSEEVFYARVVDYDKFSVTFDVEMSDCDEVWVQTHFKHAIKSFAKLPKRLAEEHVEKLKVQRLMAKEAV